MSGEGFEDLLRRAWEGLLTAVSDQDKPDHSLAIALRQKASLVHDLLSALETGLQHAFAGVRSACFAFWHTPSVQCTLGRQLQGEPPSRAGHEHGLGCRPYARPDTNPAASCLYSEEA